MNCMKCGQKIKDRQVFCEECLAIMDTYPVKPGTPVHLPMRTTLQEMKKPLKKKRENSTEEQINRLRNMVRKLSAALIAALTVIALLAGILLLNSLHSEPQSPSTRNYTATEGS